MKKQPLALCVLLALLGLLTTLVLAACGEATSTPAPSGAATTATSNTVGGVMEPTINNTSATTVSATSAAAATTAAGGSASRPGGSGSVVAGGEAALPTADASSARMTTAAATTAATATTAAASSSGAGNYAAPPPVNQDPLRAGQVDDNLKFDEYLQYLRAYHGASVLPFDVTERYIIQVMDGNARTVANSTVKVYSGQTLLFVGKTYSNGQLLFFPRANGQAAQANQFEVVADKDGHNASQSFKRVAPGQSQSSIASCKVIEPVGCNHNG